LYLTLLLQDARVGVLQVREQGSLAGPNISKFILQKVENQLSGLLDRLDRQLADLSLQRSSSQLARVFALSVEINSLRLGQGDCMDRITHFFRQALPRGSGLQFLNLQYSLAGLKLVVIGVTPQRGYPPDPPGKSCHVEDLFCTRKGDWLGV
jgi:hypothetical protein